MPARGSAPGPPEWAGTGRSARRLSGGDAAGGLARHRGRRVPFSSLGVVLLLAGCAGWAAGSLYVRQVVAPSDALLWVSMQMISGGAILGIASLTAGELPDVHVGEMTAKSIAALAYLVAFGSIIAYSAYVWLLRVTTPTRVGTYAYVNPVIALFLGWGLADEPVSFRSVAAAVIILGSVVTIVSENRSLTVRGVRLRQVGR